MIVLETERMLFRPHEQADREGFCAMEMDAEVRRYVGGAPRTRKAAEERFGENLGRVQGRLGLWATVLKAEGRYIGRCGLYPHMAGDAVVPGEAVLALYLSPAYWRRGLATEAGRAFLEFGFRELRLGRIVATVEVGNDASTRVMTNLGFELQAVERGVRSFQHFELLRARDAQVPG